MLDILAKIAWESWATLGQMAPYLLFGFLVAGILSVCFSPEFVERHLGGRGFGPVVKAAILGVPLPLCSCGVIPVAAGFRRHGASRAAVTSFLISTPQTGIDSIAVTYALLGAAFAVYRPVVAFVTGLLGGLLVMLFVQSNHNGDHDENDSHGAKCTESCCTGEKSTGSVRRALQYAFITLPRDIGLPLLLGVVIAGVITAVAPADEWKPYLGGGVLSIALMVALGIPMYVCASASVPIAVGLIHLGASPGAALAFLIAGPASNAATITTAWKLLGPRTTFLYLLTIAISAFGAGLTLDWLMVQSPALMATLPEVCEHGHGTAAGGWASAGWAVLLLVILATSHAAKYLPKGFFFMKLKGDVGSPIGGEQVILSVGGMTCEHCEATVTRTLKRCRGVASVNVNLAGGQAVVVGEKLSPDELIAAVVDAGYTAKQFMP